MVINKPIGIPIAKAFVGILFIYDNNDNANKRERERELGLAHNSSGFIFASVTDSKRLM